MRHYQDDGRRRNAKKDFSKTKIFIAPKITRDKDRILQAARTPLRPMKLYFGNDDIITK